MPYLSIGCGKIKLSLEIQLYKLTLCLLMVKNIHTSNRIKQEHLSYHQKKTFNDELMNILDRWRAVIHIDGIVESFNANKSGPIKVENTFPN